MKNRFNLVLIFAATALVGCMNQHDYMIYTSNKAKVENQTGQAISLSVCSKYTAFSQENIEKQIVQIPADPNSEITLISDSKHEIKYDRSGGFEYQSSGQINYIHFTLESSSFYVVKLCLNESTLKNIVVDKNDVCPAGSYAQPLPSYCH